MDFALAFVSTSDQDDVAMAAPVPLPRCQPCTHSTRQDSSTSGCGSTHMVAAPRHMQPAAFYFTSLCVT